MSFFIFYYFFFRVAPSILAATPIVNLTYAQYQGVPTVDPVNNESTTHFLGIRYAAAPTGKVFSPCFVSFIIDYYSLINNRALEIQRASASFLLARRSTSEYTTVQVFSSWVGHCF
jgi:hypothetical protein